jgi:hypothetical protein
MARERHPWLWEHRAGYTVGGCLFRRLHHSAHTQDPNFRPCRKDRDMCRHARYLDQDSMSKGRLAHSQAVVDSPEAPQGLTPLEAFG